MKMFNERIHFNNKLNEISSHLEKGFFVSNSKSSTVSDKKNSLPQWTELILNCFYCNAKIHIDKVDSFRNVFMNSKDKNEYIDFCPKCIKKLPNCAICLCPIEINIISGKAKGNQPTHPSHYNSESKTHVEEYKGPELKYIWCTKCRHGGHLDHIREWFGDLLICPVADCACICLEYDHILN